MGRRATDFAMKERELRLALICYGGVSLAVYMHGITREVWQLVAASRAQVDRAPDDGPIRSIYRELLDAVERHGQLRLRVLNDIIAGASAGGLNGIFLARAIATGQSLAPLTRLWLEGADVDRLMASDARPISRLTKAWATPIAWAVARRRGGAVDETVSEEAKAEISAKLSQFVRGRWFEPPFGGDRFTTMILDAFDAMAAAPAGPRLLPPGQPLDLFVTATDLYGQPQRLTLHSPPVVEEREHRVTFAFRDAAAAGLGSTAALALAARATASFPGAFPPMTVAELDAVLAERGAEWPTRKADLSALLPRRAASGTAEEALLIDGSILTNAPFAPALAALVNRPAKRSVDRRFVYLDPAPGHKAIGGSRADGVAGPGFFATIFAAISTIPREQPIRDDLEAIASRTDRIARLRRVIGALTPEVEREVDEAIGRPLFYNRPTGPRLEKWSRTVADRASHGSELARRSYQELRLNGLCEWLGLHLATASTAQSPGEVTKLLWAELHGAAEPFPDALDRLDLGFRSRRLRHLSRALVRVSAEQTQSTNDCEPLRALAFDALSRLAAVPDRVGADASLGRLLEDGSSVASLIARVGELCDLPSFDAWLSGELAARLTTLETRARQPLLRAWLGFIVLDRATLPLLQGEGLDEFDEIKVDRISPDDAVALKPVSPDSLKGLEFNHFGAFFSRRYRENDYLWGRLHGAERMVDIVLSTLPPGEQPPAEWTRSLKGRLLAAILEEEAPALRQVSALIAELHAAALVLAEGGSSD